MQPRLEGHNKDGMQPHIPMGVTSGHPDHDAPIPRMKAPSLGLPGTAQNCAAGPGCFARASRARECHCAHMPGSAWRGCGGDMTRGHSPSCAFSIEIAKLPAPGGLPAVRIVCSDHSYRALLGMKGMYLRVHCCDPSQSHWPL